MTAPGGAGFDERRLDDPARLEAADPGRLLWSLATAGAQVRRAVETSADAGIARLEGAGPLRSLLVATDVPGVSRVLDRLAGGAVPVVDWHGADLPRWAGAPDALLVAACDGRHPRLAGLVEQAGRRGLVLAVVAPARSPVAEAAGRAPVAELGEPTALRHPVAVRWAALTPLLLAAHALGVLDAPVGVLHEVAGALDGAAEAGRPSVESFLNPAKSQAADFAVALPVVVGAGSLAGAAARQIADSLQLLAGCPATAVGLPGGTATAAALLRAGRARDAEDFFRDRTEAAERRPSLLVVGDDGDPRDRMLGDERSTAQLHLDELPARRAAQALRSLAADLGLRTSAVDVPAGVPLARYAAATAFGDLSAAYLAIGLGLDPAAGAHTEPETA